jgi:hypothetical protein
MACYVAAKNIKTPDFFGLAGVFCFIVTKTLRICLRSDGRYVEFEQL